MFGPTKVNNTTAFVCLSLLISAHSHANICRQYLHRSLNAHEFAGGGGSTSTVDQVFEKFFYSPDAYQPGECPNNLKSLIEYLNEHDPSFDQHQAQVLTIYRFNPQSEKEQFSTQNLLMNGLRDIKTEKYTFHVVLEVNGKIYDTAYGNKPTIRSKEDYFNDTFIVPRIITHYYRGDLSPALVARIVDQLNYYRIADQKTLYREVRIRPMSAFEYLTSYYRKLTDENNAGTTYVWNTADEDFGSSTLGEYLNPRWNKPKPLPQGATKRPNYYFPPRLAFTFPGGVKVFVKDEQLAAGDIRQTANAVTIERMDQRFPVNFNRTDRDIELLKNFYTNDPLKAENLKNKIVVDMAAGGGQFVEELRSKGVAAYGVEIALHQRQFKHVFATQEGKKEVDPIQLIQSSEGDRFLIHADATNTGILDGSVDIVFDTLGLFDYEFRHGSENENVVFTKAISEWKRILKVGGVMRIAPAYPYYNEAISKFFKGIGGLSEPRYTYPNPESDSGFMEVTRIE